VLNKANNARKKNRVHKANKKSEKELLKEGKWLKVCIK
jgi:hypothetical protein